MIPYSEEAENLSHLFPASPPQQTDKILRFCNPKEDATRAEIIWSMLIVSKNLPAQTWQDIGEIFHVMFPNILPKYFSLSPRKFSYLVTDARGPYFRDLNAERSKENFFFHIV